jgi:hypothetical protein
MKQKTNKRGHGKNIIILTSTLLEKMKKRVLQPKRVVGIEEKFNTPNSLTNVIDNKQA